MPPQNTLNEIPYGNKPYARHYVLADDAKIYHEVYGKESMYVEAKGWLVPPKAEVVGQAGTLLPCGLGTIIYITSVSC